MGLLDDAIREHLELKRRRGADPAEIERAEREALGPIRHQAADDLEAEHEALERQGVLYDDEQEEWREPGGEASSAAGPVSADEYDDLEAPASSEHWEEEEPFPVDEPAPAASRPGSVDNLEAETSEYDVAAGEEAEGEDVLEDTPEFLQDTPEHDRLWFEQRPPRDFDFDG